MLTPVSPSHKNLPTVGTCKPSKVYPRAWRSRVFWFFLSKSPLQSLLC